MKERPILFSAPMVRALLAGTKTQTRRLVKPQPLDLRAPPHPEEGDAVAMVRHEDCDRIGQWEPLRSPYGTPGDRLWVKEAIERDGDYSNYCADGSPTLADAWPWKRDRLPGMFCPRGLSRIKLDVTGVRVERLRAITEEDARAEGVHQGEGGRMYPSARAARALSYRAGFEQLWDSINGKRASWSSNPWVWIVEFKRLSFAQWQAATA